MLQTKKLYTLEKHSTVINITPYFQQQKTRIKFSSLYKNSSFFFFHLFFLLIDRSLFCRHLHVHGNAFNAFIQSQNQEKCDNTTYRRAYIFFEKLRIYLGEPKSAARLFNEANYPNGYSLKKATRKSLRQPFCSNHEFC